MPRVVRMHATPTPHAYYTHTWTQRSYVPLMRKSVQHGTDAFQIVKDFQGHTILASVVCIYSMRILFPKYTMLLNITETPKKVCLKTSTTVSVSKLFRLTL